MEKIQSVQNERIKKAARLHQKKDRDETGLFLVEGEHLIQEALKKDAVQEIFCDIRSPFAFENTTEVSEAVMHKLSSSVSGTHVLAVCRKMQSEILDPHRLLMLDGVQDPGNLGTLVRTAVSFGFDGIFCSGDCADLYNEKTVQSSQGALFYIPCIRTDLKEKIRQLRQEGFRVYGTSLGEHTVPLESLQAQDKMLFILGNEGQGVHPEILDLCDQNLRIEMRGFESLNVAVAGGILLYRFRQKE